MHQIQTRLMIPGNQTRLMWISIGITGHTMIMVSPYQTGDSWTGRVRVPFRYENTPIVDVASISVNHIYITIYINILQIAIVALLVGAFAFIIDEHHISMNTIPADVHGTPGSKTTWII